MKKKAVPILCFLVFFLLPVHLPSAQQSKIGQPSFFDVAVTTSKNHLLLFGMLDNAFTDQMVEGLHSGLPIHFSFFVELNPTNEGWKDGKMVTLETRHAISYDTLKESYKVEIEESGKRFFVFNELIDAQKFVLYGVFILHPRPFKIGLDAVELRVGEG